MKYQCNLHNDLELGEGQFIEFKESFDKSLQREMVAFANASGGVIYLGVTDNGKIKGIEVTNKLKSQIQDLARNCDPPIAILITKIDNVLTIEIKEGANKPYACSSGFFIRMGANSQKMNRDEILAIAIKSGKIRYDEQICANFNWKDFDNEKLDYYIKLAHISNNLSQKDILKNLRVLTNEGMTNAGVLYFAKDPYKYIISSRIRCVHFNDDQRLEILDKKEIDRGIIGNIEYAVNYLKERVPVKYEIKDIKREEFPEYPIEAYREAIVNAIIHFDYFLGDTIAIEKHKSSIIIINKGELLFPETEFGKRSEARNRLLVDLLARTDYMEKAGTGIKRITDACTSNKNKVFFDFTDAFWVTFESNVLDVTENVTDNVTKNVTDNREQSILNLILTNKYITTTKLAQMLNVTRRTIARDIESLKNKGKIRRIGGNKGGYWEIIK